jgi:hypothetical protein
MYSGTGCEKTGKKEPKRVPMISPSQPPGFRRCQSRICRQKDEGGWEGQAMVGLNKQGSGQAKRQHPVCPLYPC